MGRETHYYFLCKQVGDKGKYMFHDLIETADSGIKPEPAELFLEYIHGNNQKT